MKIIIQLMPGVWLASFTEVTRHRHKAKVFDTWPDATRALEAFEKDTGQIYRYAKLTRIA